MTLELNLSPEVEAQLRADAMARRVPVETLAAQAVEAFILRPSSDADQKRREAALAGFGMFAGHGSTVDEFMAERSAEENKAPVLPKGGRRAAIEAGFGSMRGLLSSDRFLEERHAEATRELEKSQNTVWPYAGSENGS